MILEFRPHKVNFLFTSGQSADQVSQSYLTYVIKCN